MSRSWIDNKTVIITGASSGIGKEITLRLILQHNCTVIGVARSEKKMLALSEELGEAASRFTYRLFDVSKEQNWDDFVQYLEENQILPDVLINNAGILPRFDRFDRYSMKDDIKEAMEVDFYSCVYSMHKMIPVIIKSNSPAIINVSSSASLMSLAGTSMYSASKGALKSLTDAVREELRGKCYVGLVCPGFTKTDIFRNQTASGGEKAFDLISTPCDKMVNKIMRGIKRKKSRMVYGKDAFYMNVFARLMPVSGGRLFSWVIRKSKLPLFDSIFADSAKD